MRFMKISILVETNELNFKIHMTNEHEAWDLMSRLSHITTKANITTLEELCY